MEELRERIQQFIQAINNKDLNKIFALRSQCDLFRSLLLIQNQSLLINY